LNRCSWEIDLGDGKELHVVENAMRLRMEEGTGSDPHAPHFGTIGGLS